MFVAPESLEGSSCSALDAEVGPAELEKTMVYWLGRTADEEGEVEIYCWHAGLATPAAVLVFDAAALGAGCGSEGEEEAAAVWTEAV